LKQSFYPSYEEQKAKLSNAQKGILERIPALEKIDGWLLLVEATELFFLAQNIKSARPIVCEIGSWKGKSAYVFGTALKQTSGYVYCIDPFNGAGDKASTPAYKSEIAQMSVSLLENFNRTMKAHDIAEKIKTMPMLSELARNTFPETRIDLLFIDGSHEYESVKADYEMWSPLVPSGGSIVLHDVGAVHVDGPRRVFEEEILRNQKWTNVRIVGEMGVARRV
jgi:predicted O-methyltransferase YrrM